MKGELVVISFPFSDLSGAKRRPALVLADWDAEDVMLCQITTKTKADGFQVSLEVSDFEKGSLPVASHVRPNKIFTADKSIILSKAGKISAAKFQEVTAVILKLIS
ncbi:MAG TPA: type II toxin-antitoxin system PemK/MazF family toxin [Bacteroidia bacterium]|nr:type II toxin-antitoxin system PemK/MazF family toxin [Bacteroidia bacterium]